jgi:protein-disulfide isomerase
MKVWKKLLIEAAALIFIASSVVPVTAQTAPSSLTIGPPGAAFKIEAYYDAQCGSCAKFHEALRKTIARYPGKVFVKIRHFPLQLHENAFMASSAIEAARKQGKGIEMMELLLKEQSRWSGVKNPVSSFVGYSDALGLDSKKFRIDLIADDVLLAVILDMERGKRASVAATPSVFLNGRLLTYYESLELEDIISKGN